MTGTRQINSKRHFPKGFWKRLAVVVGVPVGAVFVLAFSPIGHNTEFYVKWLSCGQQPLQARGKIASPLVWYEPSPMIQVFRPSSTYFCTPLEAEQAGYSASPDRYDFPHLKQ